MVASESTCLEARLLALETTLGFVPANDESGKAKSGDLSSRLDQLEQEWKTLAPSSLNMLWEETDKIVKDLHPGPSMTYQQPSSTRNNYPIVYRKQQVLAATKTLQRDMEYLTNIVNLLLISQAGTISEESVTQAPILTSCLVTPEQEKRLSTLRVQTAEAQQKTEALAVRVDSLVRTYQTILGSLAERMLKLEQANK
mmetsp:Transcript_23524/g.39906  ORF Transcript_23524/g.39906 Transcript_23524/m.39906 type:complete len:198 (-) Transcript_23524:85-678(-)